MSEIKPVEEQELAASETDQAVVDDAVDEAVEAAVAAEESVVGDAQMESVSEDATANEPVAASEEEEDASLEIDHRRSKQLLDRALLLSERGDLAGAILAARQAVALTPHLPSGHSMLGLLHERAGDLEKAIASYERVVHLSPTSTLERDSLERLKSTLAQENASVIFHFNDSELFEEPESLPTLRAGSPSAPASATVQPVRVARTANAAAAKAESGKKPALPPSFELEIEEPVRQRSLLNQLILEPSFYFRGVPLVGTAVLGLLFVTWTQGVAQNNFILERVPLPATGTNLLDAGTMSTGTGEGGEGTGTIPQPPPPGTKITGGGIFSSTNGVKSPTGQAALVAKPKAKPTPKKPTGRAPLPLPVGVSAPIIPSPMTGPSGTGSSRAGSPFSGMPALTGRSPDATAARGVEPTAPVVAPVDTTPPAVAPITGGTGEGSRGGGFFTPGTTARGEIRIASSVRGSGAAGSRPANTASRTEGEAARLAAGGNNPGVIGKTTEIISRLPSGYAYQRRAIAFMQQGDYSRAADDFGAAISSFQQQINQGKDVDDANNGIRACRSGLNMAMERIRR